MLLIDEPETALHPSAIRSARNHLYALAEESGWQVILTTHHPAFVDPAKDHTTIVRLERDAKGAPPKVYRSEDANFSPEEKHNLRSLLSFDLSVAEMFFGSMPIVVEGDTEYAAFTAIMDADENTYPVEQRPLLLRARGKGTIPLLLKMLTHFRVNFAVLHDVDSPYSEDGKKRNSPFTINDSISKTVAEARRQGLKVVHRCSPPNFEQTMEWTCLPKRSL